MPMHLHGSKRDRFAFAHRPTLRASVMLVSFLSLCTPLVLLGRSVHARPNAKLGRIPTGARASPSNERLTTSPEKPTARGQDNTPPEPSLSPWGGTFTTSTVGVTITWCDDSTLDAPTRQVKLDGVA